MEKGDRNEERNILRRKRKIATGMSESSMEGMTEYIEQYERKYEIRKERIIQFLSPKEEEKWNILHMMCTSFTSVNCKDGRFLTTEQFFFLFLGF